MRADVKSIYANDIPNWPDWEPHALSDEFQWFTVRIGCINADAADVFQVVVASPQGIAEQQLTQPFRGLVVNNFSVDTVEGTIRAYVAQIEASTWEGIVCLLQPVFSWEFKDYHE